MLKDNFHSFSYCKKKSETDLTAAFWKKKRKRSKTHKRVKERFLIGRQTPTSKWHKRSWIVCFYEFMLYLAWKGPFSFRQPPIFNWHKISWIFSSSVFLMYVAWKRGLPRKCARFVLFRPIKKSVLLTSCVFWKILFVNNEMYAWVSIFGCCCCCYCVCPWSSSLSSSKCHVGPRVWGNNEFTKH